MYHYTAYNLAIASELAIPEFGETSPHKADVTVRFKDVSPSLDTPTKTYANWQAKPGAFLIEIEGIARYLVEGGHTVTVERFSQATDQDVRNFLLGSAFAAILQQRRILTLHASAVETPHGAVLFLGRSGYGKSTLMSQFAQRGHKMISDDITAVDIQNDTAVALPSFPSTRLTQTSLTALNLKNDFAQVGASVQKYRVPMDGLATKAVPIHAAVFLGLNSFDAPTLVELDSKTALKELTRLTFRGNFMRAMGLGDVQFVNTTKLLQNASAYQLHRVGNRPSFHDVEALICETLGL